MPVFDEPLTKVIKALKPTGGKPVNFALLLKGSEPEKLFVDKKPIRQAAVTEAKRETKSTAVVWGTLRRGGGKELRFEVAEEPPTTEIKVKKFLFEATWLQLDPKFQVIELDLDVAEEDEQEEDAKGDLAIAPSLKDDPAVLKMLEAREHYGPRVDKVVDAFPGMKADLARLFAAFAAALRKGDVDAARFALKGVKATLEQAEPRLPSGPHARRPGESTEDWKKRLPLDTYELGARLGADSGFGEVYHFRSKTPGSPRLVAKVVKHGVDEDDRKLIVESMQREASLYERLGDHPNFPKSLGMIELPDGRPALGMELVNGPDVGKAARQLGEDLKAGKLTEDEYWATVRHLCQGMLRGLALLSRKELVHQDLKLDNVMVDTETGEVKLIDVGIADDVGERHARHGESSLIRSPEVARRQMGVTLPSYDAYGIGRLVNWLTEASRFSTSKERIADLKQLEAGLKENDPWKRLTPEQALQQPFFTTAPSDEEAARRILRSQGQHVAVVDGFNEGAWRETMVNLTGAGLVQESAKGAKLTALVHDVADALASAATHLKTWSETPQEPANFAVALDVAVRATDALTRVLDALSSAKKSFRFSSVCETYWKGLEKAAEVRVAELRPTVAYGAVRDLPDDAVAAWTAVEAWARQGVEEHVTNYLDVSLSTPPHADEAKEREDNRRQDEAVAEELRRRREEGEDGLTEDDVDANVEDIPWPEWNARMLGLDRPPLQVLGFDEDLQDVLTTLASADEDQKVALQHEALAILSRFVAAAERLPQVFAYPPEHHDERQTLDASMADLVAGLKLRLADVAFRVDPDATLGGV